MRTLSKFLTVLLVCHSLGTVGCSAASVNTPGDVGKRFISYWADKNFEGCVSLLSAHAISDAGGMDGATERMRTGLFDFKNKVAAVKVLSMNVENEHVVDGTRAEPEIAATLNITPTAGEGGGVVNVIYSFTFQVLKENEMWKVDHISMAERRKSTPASTANPPAVDSLNDEAVKAVKDFWEEYASKCGNSYFSSGDFRGIITIHQYKDVSFSARQTGPNSESDRLNGILWNGEVQIRTTAYRQRNEGSWSEWGQNRSMSQGWYNVGATKRNSGWSIVQLLAISEQRKVNCSEMPQE
jgi:hypothetical protein